MAEILEKREQYMKLAREINDMKLGLIAAISELNGIVSSLVGAADGMLMEAADERAEEGKPKIQKVKYGNDDLPDAPKSKRACSICHKPGHRAPSCPDQRKGK